VGGHFYTQAYHKDGGTIRDHSPELDKADTKNPDIRRGGLGAKMFSTFGYLSAYHSFRTAVGTDQRGRYGFLSEAESPADLALAPFRFSYLLRPTTFIPLALGALTLGMTINTSSEVLAENNKRHNFHLDDVVFSSALAYNAGVGEEALFRGWMMPYMRGNGLNDEAANIASALIFGLGHLSADNRAPWFQALAGYYLGYVSQRNQWTLGESIFIHAWWDVFTISASYAFSSLDKDQPSPMIWLPPLHILF
jgi:membrane protease YdiL (CAAX protease family)